MCLFKPLRSPFEKLKNLIKQETYKQRKTNNFHHRQSNSIYQQALSQYQNIKSIFKNSIGGSALKLRPACYDTIPFHQHKNAVYLVVSRYSYI